MHINVSLFHTDTGTVDVGVFELSRVGSQGCRLNLRLGNGAVVSTEKSDYFECLRDIRSQLEPRGIQVLCQGARLNVWANGLLRQGGGARAMVFPLEGAPPPNPPGQLVNIFDPALPGQTASVDEQQKHMKKWFEMNLRGGLPPTSE